VDELGEKVVEVIPEDAGEYYIDRYRWDNIQHSGVKFWRTPLPNNFPPPKTEI
jgi:hypothetical protein